MVASVMNINDPQAIPQAIRVLNQGGLVVFPTDTVYGLAVPIHDQAGIDKIFAAKGRDYNKAIAVLIGEVDQLGELTGEFNQHAQNLAKAFWPGALTLVVNIKPGLPPNLSPYPTIGIRMPNHPFALSLLRQTGPLATTSANISGGANTSTAEEVLAQIGDKIDLLLDGGKTPVAVPSTLVDCTQPGLTILRQGSVTAEELQKYY